MAREPRRQAYGYGNAYNRMKFDDLPPSPSKLYFYGKLPPAQRRFVDELIVCQDPQKSAQRAGLSLQHQLINDMRVRCAVRERLEAITELASVTAAQVRRELKQIWEADTTELSGVWRVPCRHCWGEGNRYQYTDPEMYYVDQAHSYGENGWPHACITGEFGPVLYKHATAAWIAGKNHKQVDVKGGSGYTRTREINQECPQCHGIGDPMAYICDTRYMSEGAKSIFKGVKIGENRIEVMTMDKTHALTLLARDTQVGVERREINITMPRTREELDATIKSMSVTELEMFVGNMITLVEGEDYTPVQVGELPKRTKPNKFTRGN